MAVTVTYQTTPIGGDVNGDFQTNTYVNGAQILPDVLGLSGGGFVSAYNNVSALDGFILLNFYRADHSLIGTHREAFDNNDTDAFLQPKLTELSNGNVVVVWDDNDTADGDAGPQASIFTDKGAVVAQDINLGASVAFQDVDVAALDNGGFVLSYRDAGDIKYRTFNSSGAQTTGPITVTSATGTQVDSQVTVLSDGAFAVTWTDTNPADQPVKARIFEANGTPRGAEFTVLSNDGDNTQPSIAAGQDGELIVVSRSTGYDENDIAGDPGISLVIFDFEADEVTYAHVNEEHTGDERDPDVTVLANGYIAVTWTRPSTNDDIYCRIFDPDGGGVTDEFFIAANGFEEERESAVSAMLGGLFITSWQDSTTDGNGGSISSQVTELTRTVVGDAVGNLHVGDDLRESIDGGGGADTLHGGRGADTIDGGNFGDGIFGGDGDDLLQGNINGDSILGGAGDDLIFACTQADPTGSFNGDDIRGEAGVDTVVGSSGDDTVYGGEGEDAITGGAGNDFMFGEIGDDRLRGLSGADILSGSTGSDTINGGVGEDLIYGDSALNSSADADVLNGANGNDIIIGASGDDRIAGLGRKDTMSGRDGDDTIAGGSDKDRLDGGLGADRLTGGSEKDVFAYGSVADSAVGAEDRITDCGNHDFIDLSDIDAKAGPAGDQKFTLVDAFSGTQGELVVAYHATGPYVGFTTVRGDVDGDGAADFVIKIDGDVDKFDNFIF